MLRATLLTLTSSFTLDRSRYLRSQISSSYIAIRLERHQGHSARSHAAHLDEFVYSGQVTLPEESDQLRQHCHSATSPLGLSSRSHVAHPDEFVYSRQVTLPEESDQLRLHCHSATSPLGLSAWSHVSHLTSSSTLDRSRYLRSQISSSNIATRLHRCSASAPGATLPTLTSSSTLDRSRYLRSQISSGYIAIRLERHQGHRARSHVSHPDEFVYSGQVTLPEESDQLRQHCHSATSPLVLSARSHVAHPDEFVYSGQVTLLEESDQLRLHCRSATSPLGLSARSHVAHLNEFVYSGQVLQPKKSISLM